MSDVKIWHLLDASFSQQIEYIKQEFRLAFTQSSDLPLNAIEGQTTPCVEKAEYDALEARLKDAEEKFGLVLDSHDHECSDHGAYATTCKICNAIRVGREYFIRKGEDVK